MPLSTVLTTAQTEYQTRVGALLSGKHPSVEQLAILHHLQNLLETETSLKLLNFAASTSHSLVLAAAVRLLGIAVTNRTTTDLVLMIFNSSVAQTSGAVPIAEYALPASGSVVLDDSHFGRLGILLSAGCVLHVSTTAANLTPFNVISRQNVIGSVRHTP